MKPTLVIGASENPERYSNKAMAKLTHAGHPVYAVGLKPGKAHGIDISTQFPIEESIDTVTLYVNPARQDAYIPQILQLHPKRIIFNPGTENKAFEAQATQAGIECVEACTLVLLGTNQY